MTLRVLGGIYAQPTPLRLKGARWHARPAARAADSTAPAPASPARAPASSNPTEAAS